MNLIRARELAAKHRRSGILLDANLLMVLLVGQIDPALIPTCTRTSHYDARDLELLVTLLGESPKIIITPHVATEVSNLGGNALVGAHQSTFSATLAALLRKSKERFLEARHAVEVDEYQRLGLTDAALIQWKRRVPLVMTADLDLYIALEIRRRPAINFTQLWEQLRDLDG